MTVSVFEKVVLMLKQLRAMGCAVSIFVPEELKGVEARRVEEAMVQAGNEAIMWLTPKKTRRRKP